MVSTPNPEKGSGSSLAAEKPQNEATTNNVRNDLGIAIEGYFKQKTYTCGDKISGTVHATLAQSTRVKSLDISFKCKLKTMITTGVGDNRRTHRSKALLFLYTRRLIEVSTVLEGQNAYPFEFQFPWEVMRVGGQSIFEPNANFAHLPGHPLPPTYVLSSGGLMQAGTTQSIEFYVETVMKKEQLFGGTVKVRKEFLFSPSRVALNPDPELALRSSQHERASRKLDPTLQNERITLKERTKRLLAQGGPDPTAAFTVSSTIPSVAYVTGPLPLSLSVSYDEERSTAPIKPEITLKGAYARLSCTTSYRVPRRGVFFPASGDYMRSTTEKIDLSRRQNLNVSATTSIDLAQLLQGLCIRPHLPPTFRTYTLSVHYVLKVSVSLLCLGKEYVVDLNKCPLFIHPAVCRTPPESIGGLSARTEDVLRDLRALRTWDAPPEEEHPPPAYGDAESREWNAMVMATDRPNVGTVTQ